jgi:predicted aldo/keto reductase-like oxidoreductase
VDLWQFHEMVYDNDPDWVFDKGGIKAAIDARKAGKVRFIGFTGHKDPRIHLKMLGKPFDWDTAQMPINVMDAHYRSFQNQVVPVCLDKKVGVIGMKGYGGSSPQGIMAKSGLTAAEAYRYSLSQPVSTQVVGLTSLDQLQAAVALARSFAPMSAAEQTALRDRVRDMAGDGRYELFKSTVTFDGPHHRRQHGFAV